jgi:hypothetical protein
VSFLCARCFRGSMLASSSDTVQVQGGRGNFYLDLDPATPAPGGRAVAPARPELLHCRLPDADARPPSNDVARRKGVALAAGRSSSSLVRWSAAEFETATATIALPHHRISCTPVQGEDILSSSARG